MAILGQCHCNLFLALKSCKVASKTHGHLSLQEQKKKKMDSTEDHRPHLEMLEQPKIIIIKLIYFQNESTNSLFQKKTLQTTCTISIMPNPLGFPNQLSNLTKKALKGKQTPDMKILYFLWSPATQMEHALKKGGNQLSHVNL